MDKNEAWKNFVKTGEIEDYLEYCKFRRLEEQALGEKSKSKWNNNSRK